jgi:hypothetical protein
MDLAARTIAVREKALAIQLYCSGRRLSCSENDKATSLGRLQLQFPDCDAGSKDETRSFG